MTACSRGADSLLPVSGGWASSVLGRVSSREAGDAAVSAHLPDLPVSLCLIFIHFLPNFFIPFLTEIFSSELQTFGQNTPITSVSCPKEERSSPYLPHPGGISGEAAAGAPLSLRAAPGVVTLKPASTCRAADSPVSGPPIAFPLVFIPFYLFRTFYDEQALL